MSSLGQLSRANIAYERAISYARRFGTDPESGEPYYFIDLILINSGRCRKENFCISGIDDLTPNEPRPNLETGDEEYTFSKHKGGSIRFTENPNDPGLWSFPMWDTDFNREILASHYYLGYWKIVDDELDEIIRSRADEMRAEVIVPTALEKSVEDLNLEYKVAKKDDQQKILDKIARLINDNANQQLKPKTRTRTDTVIRKRSRIRIPLPTKPEPIKAETPVDEKLGSIKDELPGIAVDETPKEKESLSTDLVGVNETPEPKKAEIPDTVPPGIPPERLNEATDLVGEKPKPKTRARRRPKPKPKTRARRSRIVPNTTEPIKVPDKPKVDETPQPESTDLVEVKNEQHGVL